MMNRENYEKPIFEFNDLFLFDGVAEKCWGYMGTEFWVNIFKDLDGDETYDSNEDIIDSFPVKVDGGQSCTDVFLQILDQLALSAPEYAGTFEEVASKQNSKISSGENIYIPIS